MLEELKSKNFKTLTNHKGKITVALQDENTTALVSVNKHGIGAQVPNINLSKQQVYKVIDVNADQKVTITNHGPQTINLSWS